MSGFDRLQIKIGTERRDAIKNYIITGTVIVFFVGIILSYYNMIYTEKRSGIIKDGQVSAMQTADSFNDYLSTSIDAIKLTAYTMDGMIEDGRSNAEILDYLVGQSTAVTSTVFENTTGLYAYVNGEFLDGVLWVPDDDFVATERPWYKKAIGNNGKITMIEPYMDAQTGNVMMAIAKSLVDGESVVSMDITLDMIQELTEEAVRSGSSDYEVILDSHNMVVAHSDRSEVGKNYSDESGTFWAVLVDEARNTEKGYFEFDYAGSRYIAYMAEIENDWCCLSVKNATSTFRPLNMLLWITIILVIAAVVVLSHIMNKSNQRSRIAEHLNKQISSISNIYMSVYDVDLPDDSFSEIKSENSIVNSLVGDEHNNARSTIKKVMSNVTDEKMKEDTLSFVDLDTLDERMHDIDTLALEFLTMNGKWMRVRFIVSKRSDEGRISHVLWLAEDIDKERKEREKLIDMSQRAIAASEAKSAFLSNMSHEIRTPINAVLGMNEMILRESDDSAILTYSENIKAAGSTLLGIINDILDFSKIEAGKIEIIPVDYDLSSVINDLVNMVYKRADEKGLILNLDFDRNIPKLLNGDEIRVKQIITNILTNAVKYTEKGSITFSIGYDKIDDDPDSIMLNVSVKDTGIGIREEDLKKLFSEFERIDEVRNRNVEGTGLGMSITRSLLELMGSTLKVNSTYGKGSTFSFSLKQRVVGRELLGDYEGAYREHIDGRNRYHEKFTAPDARILMVDDNPMNLMVFKSLIKQTGVRIDTADSGDEGIMLSGDVKYDILFLDHMMPGKDGIETLHEIRKSQTNPNADTPAVCLTANAISGAREQYIEAGFDDYLTKPIDPEKLEEMLLFYIPEDKVSGVNEKKKEDSNEAEKTKDDHGRLSPLESSPIDVNEGIKHSGDESSYMIVLEMFYRSIDDKAEELNRLFEDKDYSNYTIKVHALKSSAKIIGAAGFGEEAQKLEDAGKAEDIPYINEHHNGFIDGLRRLGELLSPVFEEVRESGSDEVNRQSVKTEADEYLMSEFYTQIKTAAEEMDCDLLAGIFAEMAEYSVPDKEKELYDELRAASDRYEYDTIIGLLTKEKDQFGEKE
ncbi:MAG: response regulator [Lachnospiraceae bacterium]|nr:response regulator [Lachnospiraceae bacterium]